MFENFKSIKIKGGCFENETLLKLFKKDAVTVLYGRNGSGKTTIAKRIAELVMPVENRNSEFEVSTEDIAIGPGQEKQVFIFDEDFVTDQVRFRRDGIDTIVMLGEAGELDSQIEQKSEDKKKIEEKIKELSSLKEEYENEGNVKSPTFHFNKLWNALREEGGYADTERDVKGNSQRPKINEDLMNIFLGMPEPKESYEELYEGMKRDMDVYWQSENARAVYWEGINVYYPANLDELAVLLKKTVLKPTLSEREQMLLAFITAHPQDQTQQMLDEKWEFCPLCLRDMGDHDRANMVETLSKLLNDEANKYKENLGAVWERFEPLPYYLPEFPGSLFQKELYDARTVLEKLNKTIKTIRDTIEWKTVHIYAKLEQPFTEELASLYVQELTDCKRVLETLKQCVASFNKTVAEREALKNKILQTNRLVARKQLSSAFAVYKQTKADCKKNEEELEAKTKEKEKLEGEINKLTAQKERTDIALDYINKELNYVFYSNKRLQLAPSDNNKKYKLMVNGKPVTPNKISVGERNVLALSYFFATLYSDKEEKNRYNSESLIVIDDPVSSFDYGNRLGVMTLLRYQFDCILNGNKNSRILVMSHDLYSVFDLVKVKCDVCGKSKDKDEPRGYMTLENSELKPATVKNEYGILLHHIYEYATETSSTEDEEEKENAIESGIGNIMRKLLEGFASFCYNKNFMDMLNMKELFDCIEPKKKREYYSNFMFRLALNSESHLEEQTYSFNTMYMYFTKEEKLKTAKSLLLFLLYVNRLHMESYFLEKKKDEHGEEYIDRSKIKKIESWQAEEDEWIKATENAEAAS